MDACPTGGGNCGGPDLDMSQSLFEFFNPIGVGKFSITWVRSTSRSRKSIQPNLTVCLCFPFSFFLFFLSQLVYWWWWRRRTLQWRRRRKQQRRSQWRRCCCRELLFYLLLWENHSLPFNVLTSFFSQYALSLVRPPPPLPDPEKPPLLNQAKTPKLQPPLPELQLQEPASPLSLLLLLPDPALQLHPSSQSLQPLTTQSPRLPPDLLPQLLLQDPL